ncbi:MAG: hypothetical protein AAGK14_08940 [Verrucomicrobiota bacterium]
MQTITSLLDDYGNRLNGFRLSALRLASKIDEVAGGAVTIDASSQGIQLSIERDPGEASIVVELLISLSADRASAGGIKIYLEKIQDFEEWHFDNPEEAILHLISVLENPQPVNP